MINYNTIGLMMLVGGAGLILLCVLLVFVWDIPALRANVSGKTMKRAVRGLQEANRQMSGTGMSTGDLYLSSQFINGNNHIPIAKLEEDVFRPATGGLQTEWNQVEAPATSNRLSRRFRSKEAEPVTTDGVGEATGEESTGNLPYVEFVPPVPVVLEQLTEDEETGDLGRSNPRHLVTSREDLEEEEATSLLNHEDENTGVLESVHTYSESAMNVTVIEEKTNISLEEK